MFALQHCTWFGRLIPPLIHGPQHQPIPQKCLLSVTVIISSSKLNKSSSQSLQPSTNLYPFFLIPSSLSRRSHLEGGKKTHKKKTEVETISCPHQPTNPLVFMSQQELRTQTLDSERSGWYRIHLLRNLEKLPYHKFQFLIYKVRINVVAALRDLLKGVNEIKF